MINSSTIKLAKTEFPSTGVLSFFAISYFIALCANYVFYVAVIYSYSGFNLDFSGFRFALSVVLIFLYTVLFTGRELVKSTFRIVLISLVLIPTLVIYCCGRADINFLLVSLWGVTVVLICSYFPFKPLKVFTFSSVVFMRSLLALMVVYLIIIVISGGASNFNLNFTKVYEFRVASEEGLPGFFGYLSPIVGKVVLPTYIALSVLQRDRFGVICGSVCGVLIFGLTAHKSPLFYPIITLFIFYISSRGFAKKFLIALLVITCVTYIDFALAQHFDHNAWLGTLFTRRAILVSVQLNSLFIEYFSENPFTYWSHSKFSLGLVESSYSLSPANQIGLIYYDNPTMSANTGWIGSGYSNFGVLGVTIYSVVIGLFIAYASAQARRIGKSLVVSICFIEFMVITRSSDLATSMLTHGFAFLIFLLAIMPSVKNKNLPMARE